MNVTSPRSLDAALDALAHATTDTRVLAGGTDLVVEIQIGRTTPDALIDIWAVPELRGITRDDAGWHLGSLTTCTEICRYTDLPESLRAAAWEVGAEQIRNRATLGGNLGTASPAADLNPVLLALDARVTLRSLRGARTVRSEDFLTGYRATVRQPDELIEAITIPARPPGERLGFRKVGTRRAQSISKIVVATATVLDGETFTSCRAAAGCVAERTVLLPTLARDLPGQARSADRVRQVVRAAVQSDCRPIDDVRSTAQYRREVLTRVLVQLLAG